ncbi:MAG: glutathione S-transferase family protein [Pseudomonadota bacterium]|nr:glutathione S-transferase family protein [Pseudomonadota bacterium]
MRVLCHLPLSPFCRSVRIALAEKRLPFDLALEEPWQRRSEFLALNPAGDVPVLIDGANMVICGPWPLLEYLDDAYPEVPLMGTTLEARAEVRRLVSWFHDKFNREVTEPVAGQKLIRRFQKESAPDAATIRSGLARVHDHLEYISLLAEQRSWLAGNSLTMADIAACAHLSVLDYLGDVPWDRYPEARTWYARMKSRPGFRPLLSDTVPGMPPVSHYADVDF